MMISLQIHISVWHPISNSILIYLLAFDSILFYLLYRIGGGSLMVLETFSSHILLVLTFPLLILSLSTIPLFDNNNNTKKNNNNNKNNNSHDNNNNNIRNPLIIAYQSLLFHPFLVFLFFWTFKSTLTTVFVFTQRRALMVWRVFAPKYVYEGIIMVVVDILLLLSLLVVRWSYWYTLKQREHLMEYQKKKG